MLWAKNCIMEIESRRSQKIESFYSCDQQLCKFIRTKEFFYVRWNSQKAGLEHQYGWYDVMPWRPFSFDETGTDWLLDEPNDRVCHHMWNSKSEPGLLTQKKKTRGPLSSITKREKLAISLAKTFMTSSWSNVVENFKVGESRVFYIEKNCGLLHCYILIKRKELRPINLH